VSGEKCDRFVGEGEMLVAMLLPAAFPGVIEISCIFPLAKASLKGSLGCPCGICKAGGRIAACDDIQPWSCYTEYDIGNNTKEYKKK
jgi:hypothetical protein